MYTTLIQCACTVLTLLITLVPMYNKMVKNQVTKSDIDTIEKSINSMSQKLDELHTQYNSLSERVAVLEYALHTYHSIHNTLE